jgi:hypothetical protein
MSCCYYKQEDKKNSFESKGLPDIELKNANGREKTKQNKNSIFVYYIPSGLLDSGFFYFVLFSRQRSRQQGCYKAVKP